MINCDILFHFFTSVYLSSLSGSRVRVIFVRDRFSSVYNSMAIKLTQAYNESFVMHYLASEKVSYWFEKIQNFITYMTNREEAHCRIPGSEGYQLYDKLQLKPKVLWYSLQLKPKVEFPVIWFSHVFCPTTFVWNIIIKIDFFNKN